MTEVAKAEFYIVCYKRLLHSTHIVRRDTGKEIKISMEIAMLYGYMHDQYNSYTKKGCDFFESLESIGRKFKGIDRRTVKKMIDVLNALGLVTSVKQKQKEHGYDRYHHTVFEFTEIAKNLLFYGPENISGMPLADGMLIRALEKKRPRGKAKTQKSAQPKTEEKYNVKPEQREQANEHAEPTKIIVGERKPVHLVDGRDDVDISRADVQVNSGSSDKQLFPPENHPAEIPIFDQYGIITEEFIKCTDANCNEDGTLKSIWYVYVLARNEQALRGGMSNDENNANYEKYKSDARPEYIPSHLRNSNWGAEYDEPVSEFDDCPY